MKSIKRGFKRRKEELGQKRIPTYLTLLNLVCGFVSITYAISGNFRMAAIMIVAGFIFDILDGMAARILKLTTDIGIELDSLADAVTFVIAPAIIIYQSFFTVQRLSIIVSVLVVVFGIYWLAKFNITKEKGYFIGLPTPFFASIIITLVFADIVLKQELLAILVITFAYMMISPVKYPNFKGESLKKYRYRAVFIFAFMIIALLAEMKTLYLVISEYVLIWLLMGIPLYFEEQVKRRKDMILFLGGLVLITFLFYDKIDLLLFLPFLYLVIAGPLIKLSFDEKKKKIRR